VFDLNSKCTQIECQKQKLDFVDETILIALEEELYSSICQISQNTLLSKSTAYHHLIGSLGYEVKHLRWVPHRLSEEQKIRVQKSIELFCFSINETQWMEVYCHLR
jgi:hypothetical protein